MNIVFGNRYLFPDRSATNQLLSDLASQLAAQGHEAHVITTRQHCDELIA